MSCRVEAQLPRADGVRSHQQMASLPERYSGVLTHLMPGFCLPLRMHEMRLSVDGTINAYENLQGECESESFVKSAAHCPCIQSGRGAARAS